MRDAELMIDLLFLQMQEPFIQAVRGKFEHNLIVVSECKLSNLISLQKNLIYLKLLLINMGLRWLMPVLKQGFLSLNFCMSMVLL